MWVLARETVEGRWEVKRIGKISTDHVVLSCMVDQIKSSLYVSMNEFWVSAYLTFPLSGAQVGMYSCLSYLLETGYT